MALFFLILLNAPIEVAASDYQVFPEQLDIRLKIYGASEPTNKIYYFAPHQTEDVINAYLIKQIKKRGGKFIILEQDRERHIFLRFDQETVAVDPNRIFTTRGAKSSIEKLNPQLAGREDLLKRAHNRALALGEFIIKQMNGLKPHSTIVAIHNNTPGFDGDGQDGVGTVSIVRYQKRLDSGAKYLIAVHTGNHDEDDLFFLTDKSDYDYLTKAGYNAVLQHPQVAHLAGEDDGSLSVYSEMKGLRYLNVEAQRDPDHRRRQKKMLKSLFKLFATK